MIEIILKKYFEEKMTQIEIAKELNISKYKVSRTVTCDNRYIDEKEKRKHINRKKNIDFTKKYIKEIRAQRGFDTDYALLKIAHEQASRELSGGSKPISNRAFRNWNTSIYRFNDKSKCYILKNGITVGADVPKKINWNIK